MISKFIKRTIKNGKIKFNNQVWITKGDVSHLEGMRLVFGTYPPDYTFLTLWGTLRLYNNEEGAWKEWCELAGENPKIDTLYGGYGKALMLRKGEDFIAYKSRNIEWWHPEDVTPPFIGGIRVRHSDIK